MKSAFSIFLAVVILLFMSATVFEAEATNNSQIADSLAEVNNAIVTDHELENSFSYCNSDEELIKETITFLLDIKCSQLTGEDKADYDFQGFWYKNADKNNGLQYFEDYISVLKRTHARANAFFYDTSVTLTFEDISIEGNQAFVSVYEWFRYKDSRIEYNDMIAISGVGHNYNLELIKTDNTWYISSIDFHDESTEMLRSDNMSIEELLDNRFGAIEFAPPLSNNAIPDTGIMSLGIITSLNTSDFVTYATTYSSESSGTSSYNSLFPNYYNNNNDCQNFASQCLWRGLGGIENSTSISSKSRPMVSSGSYTWYHGTNKYDCSNSWTSCTFFGDYINDHSFGEGLYGDIYSGINNACVGDLIQYSTDNGATYDHVYVVVGASGTYGYRTASDLIVCAHTTNHQNANFGDLYVSSRIWRTIHVTHHWRPIDSPPVE
jgi:hypothetical protein